MFCLIIGLFALASSNVHAQTTAPGTIDSATLLIERGITAGTTPPIDTAVALLDRLLSENSADAIARHYRGYALYRKATLMSKAPNRQAFKSLLEEAERELERSSKTLLWPETFAVRSAAIGQLIGVSGALGAMRLGGRANGAMAEALRLGPNNPRVWMLNGAGSLFKPRLFGGGIDKAEQQLRRAIELFESDKTVALHPTWGRAEAHAWLGLVLARRNRVAEARAQYARALELSPGFFWVVSELIPELDRVR